MTRPTLVPMDHREVTFELGVLAREDSAGKSGASVHEEQDRIPLDVVTANEQVLFQAI